MAVFSFFCLISWIQYCLVTLSGPALLPLAPATYCNSITLCSGLENKRHIWPNSKWVLKKGVYPIWEPLSEYIYFNFLKSPELIQSIDFFKNVNFSPSNMGRKPAQENQWRTFWKADTEYPNLPEYSKDHFVGFKTTHTVVWCAHRTTLCRPHPHSRLKNYPTTTISPQLILTFFYQLYGQKFFFKKISRIFSKYWKKAYKWTVGVVCGCGQHQT